MKGTDYPLHSPVSPSLPLPCVTVCHHISTGVYVHRHFFSSFLTSCFLLYPDPLPCSPTVAHSSGHCFTSDHKISQITFRAVHNSGALCYRLSKEIRYWILKVIVLVRSRSGWYGIGLVGTDVYLCWYAIRLVVRKLQCWYAVGLVFTEFIILVRNRPSWYGR